MKDLSMLIKQETTLQFNTFDEDIAWQIGSAIYSRAISESLPIVIELQKFGSSLFFGTRPGVILDNHGWAKRKLNTVQRFSCSSYRLGHELLMENLDINQRYHLSPAEYTSAGGGFPIIVKGVGIIGGIAVSGLPERQDHQIIVDALCDFLGYERNELTL